MRGIQIVPLFLMSILLVSLPGTSYSLTTKNLRADTSVYARIADAGISPSIMSANSNTDTSDYSMPGAETLPNPISLVRLVCKAIVIDLAAKELSKLLPWSDPSDPVTGYLSPNDPNVDADVSRYKGTVFGFDLFSLEIEHLKKAKAQNVKPNLVPVPWLQGRCSCDPSLGVNARYEYVYASSAKVRDAAYGNIIGVLPSGKAVVVYGYASENTIVENRTGRWVNVAWHDDYGVRTAVMFSGLLTPGEYLGNVGYPDVSGWNQTRLVKGELYIVKQTKKGLALRNAPNINGDLIRRIPTGTELYLLRVTPHSRSIRLDDENTVDGTWVYVRSWDLRVEGYVFSSYLYPK